MPEIRRPSDAPPDLPITSISDLTFWLQVMHRRSCQDAEHLADLYERVGWLARPWYRRLFRTPPWLRGPKPRDPRKAADADLS